MGLVIQMQRRAIEDLRVAPEAIPPPAISDCCQIYDTEGCELFPLGISPGYGTCSDVKGMDVLVLTDEPTTVRQRVGSAACAYAVLVRPLSARELARDDLAQLGVSRRCVELLSPRTTGENDALIFQRTGIVAIYTKLISS